ncbi:GGDEF domain-containing protein [Lacticaseibacillus sharpeae]|uniref:Signal transduction diguanylate cyclase n=1 Tax=Lacticaseibacillus sharpeae JCM 1186 = DSM 20505 TaxID=1291052 RepID=A0A0R1ZL15_9LACO|nr:GGDEF domain-containing protein [Lacticaseibacillus sharpeae]KRM55678.1 Signal transduction diguanylate cyclase [Lacticaseibacillus sharpeae JCM 1186 = DSM 20505]
MFVETLKVLFWSVLGALGFAVLFNLLENIGNRYASKHHLLGVFAQEIPLTIGISAIMLIMRALNIPANQSDIHEYWMLISLQLIFMLYTDLMVHSVWTFSIIKVFAAISLVGTGGMTILAWLLFMVTGLVIFTESHYSSNWSPDNPLLFAIPPVIVNIAFWALMWLGWHPTFQIIATNFIGFICAFALLFINGRTQRVDQQIVARLTHEVQFDALTGVRNWLMFQEDFNREYSQAKDKTKLGVIALDLDNFKQVNDTFGHLVGNEVLTATATALEKALQDHDPSFHIYRTGGEEFTIILPHTDQVFAKSITEECQRVIRDLRIETGQGPLTLTASFGLTQAQPGDRDATATFRRADKMLYISKQSGRDTISIA